MAQPIIKPHIKDMPEFAILPVFEDVENQRFSVSAKQIH